MNDDRKCAGNGLADGLLLQKLRGLCSCPARVSMNPPGEEMLVRELLRRSRRKSGLAVFWRQVAGDYWEVILLSILFCLLGLDVLRIVRLLLR
jgi:hypothetical protein